MINSNPPSLPGLKNPHRIFQGRRFAIYSGEITRAGNEHVSREMIFHPGAVLILPIIDKDRLVMIRNNRFAVGEVLWELPAGTLEPDEMPQKTAERELIEETGYQSSKVEPLFDFYTTPGFCNEVMYCFVATDLQFIGQKLEETEEIQVEIMEWSQVLSMIANGTIRDGKTIAALLYYQTFSKK